MSTAYLRENCEKRRREMKESVSEGLILASI